jgi:hypothetical protein
VQSPCSERAAPGFSRCVPTAGTLALLLEVLRVRKLSTCASVAPDAYGLIFASDPRTFLLMTGIARAMDCDPAVPAGRGHDNVSGARTSAMQHPDHSGIELGIAGGMVRILARRACNAGSLDASRFGPRNIAL